jgi:excisionase family DNA binding protein
VSDRPADRPVPPLARASARKRAYTAGGTDKGTNTERAALGRSQQASRGAGRPRIGTLGGSNKMLSAREVAAILSVPERTVREKWRDWELPAYRIGKHLRWKEREVYAWVDRHVA